jgi:hypothetical protein
MAHRGTRRQAAICNRGQNAPTQRGNSSHYSAHRRVVRLCGSVLAVRWRQRRDRNAAGTSFCQMFFYYLQVGASSAKKAPLHSS